MTNAALKQLVVETVERLQGCKGTELAAEVASAEQIINTQEIEHLSTILPSLLDEMVRENLLIEIEYVLPLMSYRVKSFYLPKGSNPKILNPD